MAEEDVLDGRATGISPGTHEDAYSRRRTPRPGGAGRLLPTAGGGYGSARRALGARGGCRTPGGVVTTSVAFVPACGAAAAAFLADPPTAGIALLLYAVAAASFGLSGRHRLTATAPEEESAGPAQAEAELERGR